MISDDSDVVYVEDTCSRSPVGGETVGASVGAARNRLWEEGDPLPARDGSGAATKNKKVAWQQLLPGTHRGTGAGQDPDPHALHRECTGPIR